MELREETLPAVGRQDVRIRALASALSHGTEMLVYRGQVPPDLTLDLPTLRGSFGFPIKFGYASVGRVVETGETVEELAEGDLVFVHHPHQTEYVVPAPAATRLPADLAVQHGVFLANLETAVNVMLDAGVRLGERVLILGQGVVGLLLTQLARRVGAGLIIAIDPLPARQKLARALGADVVLAPGGQVVQTVQDHTDGLGVDLVLEASGSGAALAGAVDCLAVEGTVVVCSWYGTKMVTLPLGGSFHRRRLKFVSSQVSGIAAALQPRWNRQRRLAVARDLLPNLELASLITNRIPVEQAADAYALVDHSPEDIVQVILTYAHRDV